jgi:hypothetical protein
MRSPKKTKPVTVAPASAFMVCEGTRMIDAIGSVITKGQLEIPGVNEGAYAQFDDLDDLRNKLGSAGVPTLWGDTPCA